MINNIFVVTCERIPKKGSYYVKFLPNNQLLERIKELPENTRKWNPNNICWEIKTYSLYLLIKRYKGSTKIFFDFGNDTSRDIFKKEINKLQIVESDKRKFIENLNINKEKWVEYKNELEKTYTKYSDDLHKLLKDGVKLFPHQIIAAMFMNVTKNTLVSHEMGLGKCQPLYSKILTTNGWIKMGEITFEDYVIGSDGLGKKVIGIYPQGFKKMYKIKFSDNTSTVSCDEHLWTIKNNEDIKYKTYSLNYIIDNFEPNKFEIPIVSPFILDNEEFLNINDKLGYLKLLIEVNSNDYIIKIKDNEKLANDIVDLIRSLGGLCNYNNNGDIELLFDIIDNKIVNKIKKTIKSIEFIGYENGQCIKIDSEDHLYVTDDHILTHNTLSSILYVEMNNYDKVIIITPNSLKFNYYNEVLKFTNSNAYVLKWNKNNCTIEDAKYIITNYEFFNNSNYKDFKNKFDKLKIGKINAVICDESQKIKNTESNTYKNFKKTFNDTIFKNNKVSKIFLSGTPAPNRAYELYSILNQISPTDFPTKKHFNSYYCGMEFELGIGWTYNGAEMEKLEELYYKISPYTHRKKKSEVLKDLPDKTYQMIKIQMSDIELSTYNKIEKGIANDFINNDNITPLTILLRLRQFTSHLKIKHICEIIDTIIENNEKVVIVDMFIDELIELYNKYKDISVLHTGKQSVEERNEAVKQFQNPDSNIKIFIGSIQTCNYGLTLTESSKLIINTLPYSVGEYDQVADRLHRIGQKKNVNIYLMIFENSIDEYVYNIIESKKNEITKVIDNEIYESKVNESMLSELLKIFKNKYNNE